MLTLIISLFGIIPMLFGGVGIWIGVGIFALALILVMLPIEGFHGIEEENSITLIKLKRMGHAEQTNSSSPFYVEVQKHKATYAFDNRHEYELNGLAYEEVGIRGKIKVYESPGCEKPILKVFKTHPKREGWTFAPFSTKTEYVFQVPPGTVSYKVK